MRLAVLVAAFFFGAVPGFSQVTLECDFASLSNQRQPMHYHWDVSNRISPMGRFNMPVGERPSINVVRPLGGKSKNGKKLTDEDTYKWDGQKYVYDWAPLKMQIDTVLKKAKLHQLMIDNPPWAFQRGMAIDGANEVETYGNAWPPNDAKAWSSYIRSMLKELVSTYGKEQAERWRYCVGREIGTKGHWVGTRLEFFEHYRNTERAIHAILPNAKVGTHFLWASSKNSYGPDFVKWCKENNVRYDFIGVSYYPFYDKMDRVDMEHVYGADFAPIKDIPEWNPAATLELHEFALITKMNKGGDSFENAPKGHVESFTVMLAKMMYANDMVDIYRWGTGRDRVAERAFLAMKGNLCYASSKHGEPMASGNMVDAVFALDRAGHQYNIMAYNYNASPDAEYVEPVDIVVKIPAPPGTGIEYRLADYQNGRLDWSDWKKKATESLEKGTQSELKLDIRIAPFSFQKIQIRPPEEVKLANTRITRVMTQRRTGAQTEMELIGVETGKLYSYVNRRRFEVPVSSLSDEDQEFLTKWGK